MDLMEKIKTGKHTGVDNHNIFRNIIKEASEANELVPSYYRDGVHYYDLTNVKSLSHTEMARMIAEIKKLLRKHEEACFMNVNEEMRSKLKSLGLDHVIHCN